MRDGVMAVAKSPSVDVGNMPEEKAKEAGRAVGDLWDEEIALVGD